jgi:hypothetical protein
MATALYLQPQAYQCVFQHPLMGVAKTAAATGGRRSTQHLHRQEPQNHPSSHNVKHATTKRRGPGTTGLDQSQPVILDLCVSP